MSEQNQSEPTAFGALLKRHRLEAGLTQSELAERAGVSVDAVSTLERGARRSPHGDTVQRLARALDLKVNDAAALEDAVRSKRGPRAHLQEPDRTSGRRSLARARLKAAVFAALGLACAILAGLALWSSSRVLRGAGGGRLLASWPVRLPPAEPSAIAIAANGTVLVADARWDRIDRFTSQGRFLGSLAGGAGLTSPRGLALDSGGNVYVADTGNDRIVKLSPTGRVLARWGHAGNRRGEFRSPEGVAVGDDGTIYVADTRNSRVQALAPSGRPLSTWDPLGSQAGALVRPRSVVVDSFGMVYVADPNISGVVLLASDGSHYQTVQPQGRSVLPVTVAISADETVLAADATASALYAVDQNHDLLDWWLPNESRDPLLDHADALAIDSRQRVYIADASRGRIEVFSPAGKRVGGWSVPALPHDFAPFPQALAVAGTGNLYVTDAVNAAVERFTEGGRWLAGPFPLAGGPSLLSPGGIAVARDGSVLVADTGNNRIVKLSPRGRVAAMWGSLGPNPGQFEEPARVCLDAAGNVFVADTFDSRVQEFSADGRARAAWTVEEKPPPRGTVHLVASPAGIAIDRAGYVYVTDVSNDVIVKLTPQGDLVAQWGSMGTAPGQFNAPEGIAVDGSGRIYVADTGNNRVQILSPSGTVLSVVGTAGSGPGQFDRPGDVTVDRAGRVIVADSGNSRIQIFSSLK